MSYQEVIEYLLDGDPSTRYQVHRDLLDSAKEKIETEQMLVEIEKGWVFDLLNLQDEMGTWGDNIIEPLWKSTLWVVTILRRLGLSHHIPKFQLGGRVIFETGQRWDGGYNHAEETETSLICQSSLVLATMSYLKIKHPRREAIFEFLIENQMDDGGWSCARKRGAKESSFSTTLIVLEGLYEYAKINKANISTIESMQNMAHEFLLKHKLFKKTDSEDIIDGKFTKFCFPTRLEYNILEALDYFQRINHRFDERFIDAIELLRDKKIEGLWKLDYVPEGENWFVYESEGMSRVITLKAMRIFRWWAKISKFKYKN